MKNDTGGGKGEGVDLSEELDALLEHEVDAPPLREVLGCVQLLRVVPQPQPGCAFGV